MSPTADRYRRFGFEARHQAAAASQTSMQQGFELLAQGWLALADQVDWVEQRFRQLLQASPEHETTHGSKPSERDK